MENFKELKGYILGKGNELVEYLNKKREVLSQTAADAVSSVSGFVKSKGRKVVKTGAALILAGTLLFAGSGCGVKVDENGNVTSWGTKIGTVDNSGSVNDDTGSQNTSHISGGNVTNNGGQTNKDDPNYNNDGAIIEDVTPKQDYNVSGNTNNRCNNVVIEDSTSKTESSCDQTELVDDGFGDGAVIEIVDNTPCTQTPCQDSSKSEPIGIDNYNDIEIIK